MSPNFKSGCACNCRPCVCPTPTGEGCVPDACVPQPCFFNGQLITADDLNAMMTYFRTKDALLARFVGGWGVLGGLRVTAAPGMPSQPLVGTQLGPNPQIVAGTSLSIGIGVAIDALGHVMPLCAPRIFDARAMANEDPTAPTSQPCTAWFPLRGPQICNVVTGDLVASEYWVVAEYSDKPTRPAPQFAGGGASAPAPTSDITRKIAQFDIRLVRELPEEYLISGCLESTGLTLPDTGPNPDPNLLNQAADLLLEQLAELCCQRPGVVLARLLFVSNPQGLADGLPQVPIYTIIDDDLVATGTLDDNNSITVGHRRVIPSLALNWLITSGVLPGNGGS